MKYCLRRFVGCELFTWSSAGIKLTQCKTLGAGVEEGVGKDWRGKGRVGKRSGVGGSGQGQTARLRRR